MRAANQEAETSATLHEIFNATNQIKKDFKMQACSSQNTFVS